ncbi:hypothetical protein [Chitinophaga qingshengii]|uniref:Tetratricopeptide repeat protein n=1 Tax=Chitinophaga qingshengii TaxID=1569794 RepID=A0ABR7TXX3_9BACT|nr:hypothetical protein [Chitinophaga qingshengii]MBC9934600.1 hypothetical protein [Chitinophaga qingshengii]
MNYKKFIVFFISFCAVLFGNVIYTLSCGPEEDPYDYYISFFNPYPSAPGYEPFYYSGLSPFYDDAASSEYDINIGDWQRFTGDKVKAADIREYVYTYTKEEMSAVATRSTASLPDSVSKNTFARFLQEDRNQEAARYLLFAKTCEPFVSQSDRWSAPERNIPAMTALEKEAAELYEKTSNKDIRDRYAFQQVRLLHYSGRYEEAAATFDKLFKKAGSSLLYYKSLALKAGAVQHMGDSVQGAYLFSRVFDKAVPLRTSCYISMRWGNAPEEAVYNLCKDNREKAMVAAIYGMRPDELNLEPLKKVYAFDPASPAMNVLLGREISKLESMFLNKAVSTSTDSASMAAIVKLSPELASMVNVKIRPMIGWMNSIIDKGKVKDLAFWQVNSAYLSYMCRDYEVARAMLNKVNSKEPDIRNQWEVVNILLNVNEQKSIDAALETKLLASFKWLDEQMGSTPPPDKWWMSGRDRFFAKTYRNLLGAILAPKYHLQGDYVKESLIRGRCDSLKAYDYFLSGASAEDQIYGQMNSAQLLQLHNFMKSTGKTPYESYLAGFFPKGIDLDATIGESYVRVHDFKNAQPWFKKANNLAASYLVFKELYQDFGPDTAERAFSKPITQLQYVDRMLALQEKMKVTPVDAKVYYEYATGLFNITYYGRTWNFVQKYRPSTTWYTTACEKDPFEKQYFGCYAAEGYYLKAAQAATDPEFRAKCFFMAARCYQKHVTPMEDSQKYYAALVRNRYFPVLKSNYSQTRLYQEVYGQCSYLRDFVKSAK